jgi:hypothetical protein
MQGSRQVTPPSEFYECFAADVERTLHSFFKKEKPRARQKRAYRLRENMKRNKNKLINNTLRLIGTFEV